MFRIWHSSRVISTTLPILEIEETVCPFYVRLSVRDEIGVLAHITRTLADHNVSLESVIQKDGVEGEPVALILLTHAVREKDVLAALRLIEQQVFVDGSPVVLRCEALGVLREVRFDSRPSSCLRF